MADRNAVEKAIQLVAGRKAAELSRCAKACYTDELGELTLEGRTLLADQRKFARLDGSHSFLRDLTGKIDPIAMARIEGRREAVNRMIDFLELDPMVARRIVEVDDGKL